MIFTGHDNDIAIFSLKAHRHSKHTQTQIHSLHHTERMSEHL